MCIYETSPGHRYISKRCSNYRPWNHLSIGLQIERWDLGDLQTFLQFISFVSVLVTWNVSLCMNKLVLIFQWLIDNSRWGNGFFLKPPCLTAPIGLSLSTFLKHSWFAAQIYIFSCSLSSLSQLWRNYYLCSIWFFMDFIEIVSSLTIHSGDWSIAQKRTKDISGELPLALWGVTHVHMILIKRWIQTSIYLNRAIDPSLHNFDLLLFVTCLLAS